MSIQGNSETWREPFPPEEIPFILSAVLRCMNGERKKHELEKENDISLRLFNNLRCDSELLARPVHPDLEIPEINNNASDSRLDIRYIYSTGARHPWPEFAIEAKRLNVSFPSGWKSLISEYVTSNTSKPAEEEQGMMCFVSGRYSKGLRAGAMLGYVFDGNVNDAHKGISEAIQQHAAKLRLKQGTTLQPSAIVPENSDISESLHELPFLQEYAFHKDKTFVIYHLLVPV